MNIQPIVVPGTPCMSPEEPGSTCNGGSVAAGSKRKFGPKYESLPGIELLGNPKPLAVKRPSIQDSSGDAVIEVIPSLTNASPATCA